jgi:predicted lipoprotein with Yx(FWY)xxD motif
MKTIAPLILSAAMLTACAGYAPSPAAPAKMADGVLTGSNGMTLYTFDKDAAGSGKSVCNGPCATNWPPLLAADGESAGSDYSVVMRDDGRKQWAYKGKPLYHGQGPETGRSNRARRLQQPWRVAGPEDDGQPAPCWPIRRAATLRTGAGRHREAPDDLVQDTLSAPGRGWTVAAGKHLRSWLPPSCTTQDRPAAHRHPRRPRWTRTASVPGRATQIDGSRHRTACRTGRPAERTACGAAALVARGHELCEIAATLNIPPGTVMSGWRGDAAPAPDSRCLFAAAPL